MFNLYCRRSLPYLHPSPPVVANVSVLEPEHCSIRNSRSRCPSINDRWADSMDSQLEATPISDLVCSDPNCSAPSQQRSTNSQGIVTIHNDQDPHREFTLRLLCSINPHVLCASQIGAGLSFVVRSEQRSCPYRRELGALARHGEQPGPRHSQVCSVSFCCIQRFDILTFWSVAVLHS